MAICILLMIFVFLDTSQHIGLHTRMFAYVSAFVNVADSAYLCIRYYVTQWNLCTLKCDHTTEDCLRYCGYLTVL